MNGFDIFFGIVIVFFAIKGLLKGFIFEIFSILSAIVGVAISFRFAYIFENLINSFSDFGKLTSILSFIICFAIVVLVVALASKIVDKIIKIANLGIFNRILGGVLGFFKGIVLVAAIVFLIEIIDSKNNFIFKHETKENSKYYYTLADIFPKYLPVITKKINKNEAIEKQLL